METYTAEQFAISAYLIKPYSLVVGKMSTTVNIRVVFFMSRKYLIFHI